MGYLVVCYGCWCDYVPRCGLVFLIKGFTKARQQQERYFLRGGYTPTAAADPATAADPAHKCKTNDAAGGGIHPPLRSSVAIA
jgi:hypothetical protein